MAQGQFTKEESKETQKAVEEMFEAIPRSKRMGFLGHLNGISLFISAAQVAAPTEAEIKAQAESLLDPTTNQQR